MQAFLHREIRSSPASVFPLPPGTKRLPEVVLVGDLAYVLRSVSNGDGHYYRAECLRLFEDDPQ